MSITRTDMASTLASLGVCVPEVGQREEAVAFDRRSFTICKDELAADDVIMVQGAGRVESCASLQTRCK